MIRVPRSGRRAAILFATAVTATQACSAGRDDIGTNPTPSITLSINPASATVVQGGSVDVTATLTGSGGFTGTLATFALTGAPAGVTFTVSNFQTSGAITTATVTISVAAAVTLGTYAMNLTGSGNGVSPASVSFALTVAVAVVGFTISANPATLTTCEGCAAQTATITINRTNGFTGNVALSVSSSPVGDGGSFTMALNPTNTAGNSSILTVSTSAPPGNYTLTITGAAAGLVTQTVTIAVTVQ